VSGWKLAVAAVGRGSGGRAAASGPDFFPPTAFRGAESGKIGGGADVASVGSAAARQCRWADCPASSRLQPDIITCWRWSIAARCGHGRNQQGELGDGTTIKRTTPVQVAVL